MTAYLKTHQNIKYVVVYALSRTARNRYDDAMLMMTPEKLKVKLISATERNLDDSPAGKAMHGFIAVMNQYRCDPDTRRHQVQDGSEGYRQGRQHWRCQSGLSERTRYVKGREIRTIAVDEKRAPLRP